MANTQSISGVKELWSRTVGDSAIRIAILDGSVDFEHECFQGTKFAQAPGETHEHQPGVALQGWAKDHGTLVASIIFGQHGSSVWGMAPGCSGYLVPLFSDSGGKPSQLDLARTIERALDLDVHVINISAGQLTEDGEADDLLVRAIRSCADRNVLVVAAAGNDGCECLHVPASLPSVLAVGALDDNGEPLGFSNWGETYRSQGVLAPGENILGAKPGGGTVRRSGTSMAAPVVSGVAALLLSLQLKEGKKADPGAVRAAILESADPCNLKDVRECDRFLVGKLNVGKAVDALIASKGGKMSSLNETTMDSPAVSVDQSALQPSCQCQPKAASNIVSEASAMSVGPAVAPSHISGLVYALGTLGYDFGTEARRDSFKQLMPPVIVSIGGKNVPVPANPYDARQMAVYLGQQPSEARSLIWTLSLDLTPIYAIEPGGPYGADVYRALVDLLTGELQAEDNAEFVERVSIPGIQAGRTVRLFSGQHVPVISLENVRGVYGWHVNALIDAALAAVDSSQKSKTGPSTSKAAAPDQNTMRRNIRDFLSRLYYDFRNLGATSPDRALNFAATNIFVAVQVFAQAIGDGKMLDGIQVVKSPFCRMDSDCWDVKLNFFDPENSQRAHSVFRFTIDVSDLIPVTLGGVAGWSQSS